jgi:hypothetical protein
MESASRAAASIEARTEATFLTPKEGGDFCIETGVGVGAMVAGAVTSAVEEVAAATDRCFGKFWMSLSPLVRPATPDVAAAAADNPSSPSV